MALRAIPFTVSAKIADADQAVTISGLTAGAGITSVIVHNSVDNTGDVVLYATGPGTISLNTPIRCDKGIYVEVAGSGKGTVHL